MFSPLNIIFSLGSSLPMKKINLQFVHNHFLTSKLFLKKSSLSTNHKKENLTKGESYQQHQEGLR